MTDIITTSFESAGPVVPTFTNARQISSALGVEDFPTWSADGQTLAYESNQTGNLEIWVQQIEGGVPISRTPDSDSSNSNPSWSPDARNIAFVSSQETGRAYHVMSALGGEARRVMATANDAMLFGAPQWLSGGAELAGVAEDGTALEIFELAHETIASAHASGRSKRYCRLELVPGRAALGLRGCRESPSPNLADMDDASG